MDCGGKGEIMADLCPFCNLSTGGEHEWGCPLHPSRTVIKPTPVLDVDATNKFLEQVAKDLQEPVGPVPTPRVDKAIEKIKGGS